MWAGRRRSFEKGGGIEREEEKRVMCETRVRTFGSVDHEVGDVGSKGTCARRRVEVGRKGQVRGDFSARLRLLAFRRFRLLAPDTYRAVTRQRLEPGNF